MERKFGATRLLLVEGDITARDEDAIVNPANEYLKHGGGVAGLIVRRGGRVIQEESDAIGHCPVGSAVITSAGSLKARHVIHAVGPRWGEGEEERKLAGAVLASMTLAEREGLKSVALPAISTGIFGYPLREAAHCILKTIVGHLEQGSSLRIVVLCLYGVDAFETFCGTLEGLYD